MRTSIFSRAARLMSLVIFSLPAVAGAQTVYRHVDENGVVSFSDVETDGAEVMDLEVAAVREGAMVEQREMIDQQLAVAKVLEESRLAREDARTRRLEALAAQPETVYYREEDRSRHVGGSWGYWGRPGWPNRPGHPGHPGKPVHPIAPPPEFPPSRPVPLPPLNGSGL